MIQLGFSGLLVTLMLLLIQSVASGETTTPSKGSPTADEEIERGLNKLRALKTYEGKYEWYAQSLGFTSAEQAARAMPGRPLIVYGVRLERLERFLKGTKPEEILDDQPRNLLVPILADGEIRSSFLVAEFKNIKTWLIIGQGSLNLLREKRPEYIAKMDAVVLIPDLGLRFLARNVAGEFILIPMKDYPLFNLKADTELLSGEVFKNLAPIAKRIAEAIADSPKDDEP